MKQRTGRFIGVVSLLLLFLSAGATTNASAQRPGPRCEGGHDDRATRTFSPSPQIEIRESFSSLLAFSWDKGSRLLR